MNTLLRFGGSIFAGLAAAGCMVVYFGYVVLLFLFAPSTDEEE